MATSSIFASFDIEDAETLNALADALEQAEQEVPKQATFAVKPPLADPVKIAELWAKRKNR